MPGKTEVSPQRCTRLIVFFLEKTYDGGMAEAPFCEAHGTYFLHLFSLILCPALIPYYFSVSAHNTRQRV